MRDEQDCKACEGSGRITASILRRTLSVCEDCGGLGVAPVEDED